MMESTIIGLLLGLAAGGGVGALVAFAIAITKRDGIWPNAVAILIIIGALAGAVIGALAGLAS